MSARVDSAGVVTQLGPKLEPDEVVTETDVQDAPKLSRLLGRVLRDIAELRRRWVPRSMDFEDITVGASGAVVRLQHNFGGRVRWWIVDHQVIGAATAPILQKSTASTNDELVLLSYDTALVSIRVEEAG